MSRFWFSNPRSLINTRKSKSPRRVPWGPPTGSDLILEFFPLYLTIILLSFRNAITIFKSQPGTPMSQSLVIRILWFCLLNALEKSTIQARIATWSLPSCFQRIKFIQAGAELGQAQLQLELGFTLIKVYCIILMVTNYHYISLSTISV